VLLGPALRDRAGVVARVPLVLVGAVVLLVDHDQPDVAQRREHRRARPHADAGLAAAQAQPLLLAFALAKARMEHGDDVAEAGLEAAHRLWRQPDLGHEDDRPAPRGQSRLNRPQVHLGLARPGHTVEQEALGRAMARLSERAKHGIECAALLAGQSRDPVEAPSDGGRPRARSTAQRAEQNQAPVLETAKRGRPDRRGQRGPPLLELRERRPLAVGQPFLAAQRGHARLGQRRDQDRLRLPAPARCAGR